MQNKIYHARKGAQFNDEQAQIFGPHLEILAEKRGTILTPYDVVEDGKKKSSPLHNYFEWDDEEASQKWRLHQARHLLGNIMVEIRELNSEPVRAFYNVKDGFEDSNRAYISIDKAMSEEEYRRQIVAEAMREVKAWRERYRVYNELLSIFKVIDAMDKKI